MPADYVEGENRRAPWDRVEGGYSRREIDRDFGMPQGEFYNLDGLGLIDAAIDQYKNNSELAILDAGCGTGNQLFSLVEELSDYRGIPRNAINAVGVSDIDFSNESEFWMPRAAVAEGDITYGIGDLNTEQLLPEQFNLIYSYEVLFHNEEPDLIVNNLWQALKSGGALYFNAGANQRTSLVAVLEEISEQGGEILFGEAIPPLAARTDSEFFIGRDTYRITKP